MSDSMDLGLVAKQVRWNSERWFPDLHSDKHFGHLTVHYALGLCGEVGEVANLVKKADRAGAARPHTEKLADELADVFTYLLLLADECKIDLLKSFEAKQAECERRWG